MSDIVWCFVSLNLIAAQSILSLSIVGQHKFYTTLSNILGIGQVICGFCDLAHSPISRLISCTSPGAWIAALCVEHLYFRKGNFSLYNIEDWNVPWRLPLGAAALGASALSFALVIPSMNQVWYTGPIARKIGDIGFEAAFVVTALLYIPLRHLEKNWRGV